MKPVGYFNLGNVVLGFGIFLVIAAAAVGWNTFSCFRAVYTQTPTTIGCPSNAFDLTIGLYTFIALLAASLVTVLSGVIMSASGHLSMQIHPEPKKKLGCYKCGRPVDEADRFCRSCGADIEEGTLKASISSGSPSPSLDS